MDSLKTTQCQIMIMSQSLCSKITNMILEQA